MHIIDEDTRRFGRLLHYAGVLATVTPGLGAGIERGGDDLRFEVLPGAGHFVCDTHAAVLAERLRSFR